MYELIIIGGGPAGIAAGVYAARKKIGALLLTKDFGGQSVNSASIENWIGFPSISGADFAKRLEDHLRAQEGITIRAGVTVKSIEDKGDFFELRTSKEETFQAKKLLITVGSRYRRLGVPGEETYEGRGVFYCSICDAPLMKDKKVVVVGGGNSGLEAAIDLIPYASNITVLEYTDSLKGDPIYRDTIGKEKKITVVTNAQVEKIEGADFVEQISYRDRASGESHTLPVSGVFVEIGYQPNNELVSDLVTLDEGGRIVVDHKTFKTSHERIWAAGDLTDGLYNQINPAMGDGVKALLNIYDSIVKEGE